MVPTLGIMYFCPHQVAGLGFYYLLINLLDYVTAFGSINF